MHSTKGLVAIVDDDDSVRRSIDRLLRANEYTTAVFASAEEFLASAIVGRAIGLVLDIHLGGMSGIELRRRLVAQKREVPVVFITAMHDDATRAAALAVGCVDYLEKPFDPDQLVDALERFEAK